MESTIDLSANAIDVRDIIERVEELETNRDTFNAVKESEGDSWAEHEPSDAEELQQDYSSVEIEGADYWYR